jgi:cytochrome c oxidase subunit 2
MRGTIIVETQTQYDAWLTKQQSYYALNNAPAEPAAPGGPAKQDSVKMDTVKAVTMK